MTVRNIDAVVFGVEDLSEAERFLTDWGLTRKTAGPGVLAYEATNGAEVMARQKDDPALPPAMAPGSTLREVIWGCESEEDLGRLEARLRASGPVSQGQDGLLRAVDSNGLTHAFRVSVLRPVDISPVLTNGPGYRNRVNRRSPVYERAVPKGIGHVVLFVNDLQAMRSFFVDRLGFVVSDSYPGQAVFLRAQARGVHHNVFLLERKGRPGLNHVAFAVNDIHEVFGGGLAMSRKGWQTEIGPGRHPISSAYFWYFQSPFGGALEYFADEDACTEEWVPNEFERRPENFAEWAILGGLDGNTRRQTTNPAALHEPEGRGK
ncbi:MAG: VOC family protein [Steroidobacteraceae bacterium]